MMIVFKPILLITQQELFRLILQTIFYIIVHGCIQAPFSPSGQYLYVSYYHPGILYQFDMTQNTLPPVVVGQTPMYMCDLALAPDNKIYVVELWSTYLGAINYPDAQGRCVAMIPMLFL